MLNKILTALIVASLSLTPLFSFGQAVPTTLANELNVEINPTYPRPNGQVSVVLSMYTENLDSATITWYKDGKSVLSGKGEKRYSFEAGAAGEETRIEIRVTLLSGASFSKSFTISPTSVDLIWEANSYTPPFYRGKALHSSQGALKIVAMPEFISGNRRISPQNLIYEWSNDVSAYQSQSGYGKNVLVLNGSILGKSERVRVLVKDPSSNLTASASITINPKTPEIIFYENSPYYGHIFDRALTQEFELKSEEVQISSAPYYFSKENLGLLKYEWRLNGQSAPSLFGSRTAIFRKPEENRGRSSISLRIENTDRILQQAEGSLVMKFDN